MHTAVHTHIYHCGNFLIFTTLLFLATGTPAVVIVEYWYEVQQYLLTLVLLVTWCTNVHIYFSSTCDIFYWYYCCCTWYSVYMYVLYI